MAFMHNLVALLASCLMAEAAVVTYDFNVSWVMRNPDGLFERPVIGINGQWPIPTIYATNGDRVIVNVHNQLGNESTSIHFHGLYQNGTADMDGVVGTTQCGIAPGESFTYNFTLNQTGTYWYHSHLVGQYPDGFRGPLIVLDPDSPFKGQYEKAFTLSVSDWYHEQIPNLLPTFLSVTNPTGAEPVPDSSLMNDTFNATTMVEPGKTYMFQILNIGAFAGQYFWFQDHNMTIVEVDGIYTKPTECSMIYITAAQRYGVLVTMKNDTSANFPYVGSMDQDLFDVIPPTLNPNGTGWLVYNENADKPDADLLDEFDPFDDFTLVPYDEEPLFENVDQSFTFDVIMDVFDNGENYATFNNVPYFSPKVPTLYSVMSTGEVANNATVYGTFTSSIVLQPDQVIEMVINNHDAGKHPFHLHGHNFQAVVRSEEGANDYVGNETFPKTPMRRDTFMVQPNGNIVIRYRSDNPGVWLFHCHIEWHIVSGLVLTVVEDPMQIQKTLQIPESHYDNCIKSGNLTAGNAAGNTKDFFDLSGQNSPPPPLPAGWTPKGIVAMTFSVLAALLGMAMVSWYGAGEIGKREPAEHFWKHELDVGGVSSAVAQDGAEGDGAAIERRHTDLIDVSEK